MPPSGCRVATSTHRPGTPTAKTPQTRHLFTDGPARHHPSCNSSSPGQSYQREQPPLHAVLDGLSGVNLPIVDGYADPDPGGRPSLGAHAHPEFGRRSSA